MESKLPVDLNHAAAETMTKVASEANALAVAKPTEDGTAAQLAIVGTGDDMLARFEALSQLFRSEVEGLVGQEQAASKQTSEEFQRRIAELEEAVTNDTVLATRIANRLRAFMGKHQRSCLERVFGTADLLAEPETHSVSELEQIIEAFMSVNEQEQHPELLAARGQICQLEECLAGREDEMKVLREELAVARALKSQEERELCEFSKLREKESELQELRIQFSQVRFQCEEFQTSHKMLLAQTSQTESALADRSRKLATLRRQIEEGVEHCRLLSNENNTLRLQLGKDSEYVKAVQPPADPLSYISKLGTLGVELQQEERRLLDDLESMLLKFPGLLVDSDNCRKWCGVHISRQAVVYRSFLHLLQDSRQDSTTGIDMEFVSRAQEVDAAWLQQEEEMRAADAVFQEQEQSFAEQWEEKRLQITQERDAKIKQLSEQAEKAQTKAENQLLLQQARLFGQRMDTEIERLWEEQRKERDLRWEEHNNSKKDNRQRLKDESLAVQQHVEIASTTSERFEDMAKMRLAGVEDAWVRKVEKASAVNAALLRDGDLARLLHACGLQQPSIPAVGSMYAGVAQVAERLEDLVAVRLQNRQQLREELEAHNLQQLKACVEKFVQKEGAQRKTTGVSSTDEEKAPEYTQAIGIQALLGAQQHRVVADTVRRQFHDFLLLVRIASLSAVRLLPKDAAQGFASRSTKLDLPLPPPELSTCAGIDLPSALDANAVTTCPENNTQSAPASTAEVCADELLEGRFLYDGLLRRLLERGLSPLQAQHREEMLKIKRAHAREVRLVLQHLCQMEGQAVDKVIEQDVSEFRCQIMAKLTDDYEFQLCEERRQLSEQLEQDADFSVQEYQRRLLQEELAALTERRKWLTERIIVLQSHGATSAGDRAVLHHLRSELRACEARFEKCDREKGSVSTDGVTGTSAPPATVDTSHSQRLPPKPAPRPPAPPSAAVPPVTPRSQFCNPRVADVAETQNGKTDSVVPPVWRSSNLASNRRPPTLAQPCSPTSVRLGPKSPRQARSHSPSCGGAKPRGENKKEALPFHDRRFAADAAGVRANTGDAKASSRSWSASKLPDVLPPIQPASARQSSTLVDVCKGGEDAALHGNCPRQTAGDGVTVPAAASVGRARLPPVPAPRHANGRVA
mmetsp:Transcript_104851/g.208404  ORF Transcript_104851/g.208404 Transcript_104851/m.208404 type:complete len:1145 (-) Transcript_104851:64-3498(-)